MDIALDENFDFVLDDRNDAPVARRQDLFEQRLRIYITSYFTSVIGSTDEQEVIDLLEVKSREAVDLFGEIESVASIQGEYDQDTPNLINMKITYDTGDSFTFEISE